MPETLTPSQKRALDVTKSTCVTAGAGTGKTFILSQRYRSVLLQNHANKQFSPANILALTFTEKAAAEMRERIAADLSEDIRACSDPTVQQGLLRMQDEFYRASVTTFHSFASSILREFAVEAGLDPSFGIMDAGSQSDLVHTTVTALLTHPPEDLRQDVLCLLQYLKSDTLSSLLAYALDDWRKAEPWFQQLEENPDAVRELWETTSADFLVLVRDNLVQNQEICQTIGEISAVVGETKYGETVTENWQKLKAAESTAEILAALRGLKGANKGNICLTGIDETIFKDPINEILNMDLDPGKPPFDEISLVLISFGRVLRAAAKSIDAEKQRLNLLDFDDLIYRAVRLITENPAVLSELWERYRYILVDEVQDNDPRLTDLILRLAGSPAASDRLFIVGDLKQSIYRFRGADIRKNSALFDAFPATSRVSLDVSFRTVPEIVHLVNTVFSQVFTGAARSYDVSYDALSANRTQDTGSVQLLCRKKEQGEDTSTARMRESEDIAAWIAGSVRNQTLLIKTKDGVSRPAEYGDIAVLLNTRTPLPQLTAALQKFSVPYLIYKSGMLYQQQETYDFSNLLEVIINPENDAALYGLLRSPWFGISDADLCRLRTGRFSLWKDVRDSPLAESVVQTIRHWQKLSLQQPIGRFLRTVLRESGILTTYAAMQGGDLIIVNLEKLISLLEGTDSLIHAAMQLRENILNKKINEDEGDVTPGNRVQILTIHAAKGLEYPVVIAAFTGDGKRDELDSWIFDEQLGPAFSLQVRKSDAKDVSVKTFVQNYLKPDEITAEKMEIKRKLYVALTRARDHLIISGTYMNQDGSASKNSFLSLLDKDILRSCGACECRIPAIPEAESRDTAEDVLENWVDTPTVFCEDTKSDVPYIRPSMQTSSAPGSEEAMVRGSALHAVFAGLSSERACEMYGISAEDAESFAAMREEFFSSPLYLGCKEDYAELSLQFPQDDTWVRGRVDRILVHEERIVVVDFKSGHRESCGSLMEGYKQELLTYLAGVEQLFGKRPEGYLYFPEDEEKILPVSF
ncbi:MAG TPA: UvrD-helicase domain-containing protein [Methanocorpusculum sp.]|nr:UvrD-helicase domain-containing protein [Methanocorpusculum sp.]